MFLESNVGSKVLRYKFSVKYWDYVRIGVKLPSN